MTILRLAHLDLEGLVLDAQVRSLRDQVSPASFLAVSLQ
jgi:hypothetical protein